MIVITGYWGYTGGQPLNESKCSCFVMCTTMKIRAFTTNKSHLQINSVVISKGEYLDFSDGSKWFRCLETLLYCAPCRNFRLIWHLRGVRKFWLKFKLIYKIVSYYFSFKCIGCLCMLSTIFSHRPPLWSLSEKLLNLSQMSDPSDVPLGCCVKIRSFF